MSYVKTVWRDLPDRTTPITAARLNNLEKQYDAVAADADDLGSPVGAALGLAFAAAAEVDVSKYGSPQEAVDAAQALGQPVVVKFGKGEYVTTAPIVVTASDVTLDMGSALVTSRHAGAAIRFDGTGGARLARVGIRGGRIDLTGVGASGVLFAYCDGPQAERVSVVNGASVSGSAIGLDNCTDALVRGIRASTVGSGVTATASLRTLITGCLFKSLQRDGVTLFSGSHDSTVSGILVSGYNLAAEFGRAGVHVYGSDRCSVSACTIDSGSVSGTDDSPKIRFRDALDFACSGNMVSGIKGGGIGVIALSDIGNGAGKGSITGNTIRDVSAYGVQVALGSGGVATSLFPVAIAGNTIIGVRASGSNAGIGISLVSGADAGVVSANYLEDLDGEGIFTACKVAVTGNTIRNAGKGSLGAKVGIYVTASTAVVVGNYCFDDQTVKTMTNGLRIISGAVARCAGNLFEGATSAAIRNDGTLEAQVGDIASGRVGFFGTTPIVRPAGTPAAATDAATTQTLVNDLRSKLLSLGLIA